MDKIENLSGWPSLQKCVFGEGANESYFSYEDLPSNQFSFDNQRPFNNYKPVKVHYLLGLVTMDGEEITRKSGADLISSIKKVFANAKATNPEAAPNWKKIPFEDHGERKRLPEKP